MVDLGNLELWSLLGTWVLVVGTLVLLYWQTRTSQHLNSANAVMALRERFDNAHMRAARRHLSSQLLAQGNDDITSVEVVTFFELIGTLTHHGVLDADLVWEAFGNWIEAYYWGIRNPVDRVAKVRAELGDPLVFHELEWLHETMVSIDVHHEARAPVGGEASIRRILELEAKLASL